MDLAEIKKTSLARKRPIRVGRGSGSGKGCTSGKGTKGQNSRSGATLPVVFEGGTMPLYRRLPKRGFNNAPFCKNWIVVNVDQLNKFADGAEVNHESLAKAKIIKSHKSRKKQFIKILGRGELQVKDLKVKVHGISKTAREQLEKNNGSVEMIVAYKPKKGKFRRRNS